jgi:mono/diheme cytochrome c family protein
VLAIAVLAIGIAAAAWRVAGQRTGPDRIASGRQVYAEHCASCHGAELQGQPDWQTRLPNGRMPAPPHDASGHTWHHSDAQLFAIVKNGVSAIVPGYESDMPGFTGVLNDDQIRLVLAFIKSTWPDRERAYQAERSRAYRQSPPTR